MRKAGLIFVVYVYSFALYTLTNQGRATRAESMLELVSARSGHFIARLPSNHFIQLTPEILSRASIEEIAISIGCEVTRVRDILVLKPQQTPLIGYVSKERAQQLLHLLEHMPIDCARWLASGHLLNIDKLPHEVRNGLIRLWGKQDFGMDNVLSLLSLYWMPGVAINFKARVREMASAGGKIIWLRMRHFHAVNHVKAVTSDVFEHVRPWELPTPSSKRDTLEFQHHQSQSKKQQPSNEVAFDGIAIIIKPSGTYKLSKLLSIISKTLNAEIKVASGIQGSVYVSAGKYRPINLLEAIAYAIDACVRKVGRMYFLARAQALPASPWIRIPPHIRQALQEQFESKFTPDKILQNEGIPLPWQWFEEERVIPFSALETKQKVFLLALLTEYSAAVKFFQEHAPRSPIPWCSTMDEDWISYKSDYILARIKAGKADLSKYVRIAGMEGALIKFYFPIFVCRMGFYKPDKVQTWQNLTAILWFVPSQRYLYGR